jgi:TonB family protein
MKFVDFWIETPLAQALGWSLVHSLWQGAIVSAALAAVLLTARSARLRYAAACAAMVAIVAGVVLTFARLMPEASDGVHSGGALLFAPWNIPTGAEMLEASTASFAAFVPWLTPLWILGMWFCVLWQITGMVSAGRLRREGVCCAAERWQQRLRELSERLRLSRPVLLLESCLVDVPLVVGHLRPVVLMPVSLLSGMPAEQIEAVLLHELAHVRRCDYLVNVMQRSVESLFFYNPAVWWISHVIRTERENCCDDMVVKTNGNAREYATALAALEENRWSRRQPALAATGGSLVKRVHRLLYPRKAPISWIPAASAVILLLTTGAALAMWPPKPMQQNSTAAQSNKEESQESKYDKWLKEDVVYIITPEEQEAFAKLGTDEERDKFIEQFWVRRNPNPGSAENKFKEEHYRRISFANQHFAADSKPGWQTDRGHIYIVYGPPDQIDSHPDGKPRAYEQWMYKHAAGHEDNWVVTFRDKSGKGDYRLAPTAMNEDSQRSDLPESGKNGYSNPMCVYCPQPEYTPEALEHKTQGTVKLTLVITADGRAEDIEATQKLGDGLTEAAIEGVSKWKFKPATGPNGEPAATRTVIEVGFHAY